jgi:hypothetical protein
MAHAWPKYSPHPATLASKAKSRVSSPSITRRRIKIEGSQRNRRVLRNKFTGLATAEAVSNMHPSIDTLLILSYVILC